MKFQHFCSFIVLASRQLAINVLGLYVRRSIEFDKVILFLVSLMSLYMRPARQKSGSKNKNRIVRKDIRQRGNPSWGQLISTGRVYLTTLPFGYCLMYPYT